MAINVSGSPHPSGSAKIFTFPPRGRYALRDHGSGLTAAANMQAPQGAHSAPATGWYHDAAIRADEGREN